KLILTACALKSVPSWNLTPCCKWRTSVVGSLYSHDCASSGFNVKSLSRRTSGLKIDWNTCRSTAAVDISGSLVVKSEARPTRNGPPRVTLAAAAVGAAGAVVGAAGAAVAAAGGCGAVVALGAGVEGAPQAASAAIKTTNNADRMVMLFTLRSLLPR